MGVWHCARKAWSGERRCSSSPIVPLGCRIWAHLTNAVVHLIPYEDERGRGGHTDGEVEVCARADAVSEF
eukprot:7286113-Prymnesium_polylepis.2